MSLELFLTSTRCPKLNLQVHLVDSVRFDLFLFESGFAVMGPILVSNLTLFLVYEFLNADTVFQSMYLFGPSLQLISAGQES